MILTAVHYTFSLATHSILTGVLDLPNCGNPGAASNAVLVKSTYWAGKYVRYMCHPGYIMYGPAVRRCLPSGRWSGVAAPLCKNLPLSHLKIRNFSSSIKKIFQDWKQRTSEIFFNTLCCITFSNTMGIPHCCALYIIVYSALFLSRNLMQHSPSCLDCEKSLHC